MIPDRRGFGCGVPEAGSLGGAGVVIGREDALEEPGGGTPTFTAYPRGGVDFAELRAGGSET